MLKGVSNIGTYYYDDGQTRTSGEFDVVLQKKQQYDIYEVKYYHAPMSIDDVKKAAEKIRGIKGLQVDQVGFISVNGFEKKEADYVFVDGEALYN